MKFDVLRNCHDVSQGAVMEQERRHVKFWEETKENRIRSVEMF